LAKPQSLRVRSFHTTPDFTASLVAASLSVTSDAVGASVMVNSNTGVALANAGAAGAPEPILTNHS